MFELKEQNPISYLKQISPLHRFDKVAEITIDSNNLNPKDIDRDSIKILSWNIAKNNHNGNWNRDFLTILKQHRPATS